MIVYTHLDNHDDHTAIILARKWQLKLVQCVCTAFSFIFGFNINR